MHLKNLLSKNDAICLLELIQKSFLCSKEEDLRNLISDLKMLIPYDHAVCLLGKKGINDNVSSYDALNVSFPSEWFDLYVMKDFHKIDPVVKENFTSFALQYWADTYKKYETPKNFIMAAEDFDLKRGYSYGIKNYRGTEGSLFSFAGNSIECNRRTEIILTHIIPALHQALTRIVSYRSEKHAVTLSEREKEVLRWISYGKRIWDISVILGISERTVKFHIKNIMQKLDVVTMAQAVAVAMEQGLIDIE
ncbi:MAG: autoinducer binding domain-containing protein [Nitrospirae bacterium]|nr:autoinducer binding domain-containing protein [Nitrospirota bacterium]MBI3377192.1 autoinducer binding domain-containing protein [Nitrospirota bacterium]